MSATVVVAHRHEPASHGPAVDEVIAPADLLGLGRVVLLVALVEADPADVVLAHPVQVGQRLGRLEREQVRVEDRQLAMAAGGHDLALEAAADDRAAEDDDLGLVLLERREAGRRGVVGHRGRVLDHVRDVPVDAAHAAAVARAVDPDEVLEPRPRLGDGR